MSERKTRTSYRLEGSALDAANKLGHDPADIAHPDEPPDPTESCARVKKLVRKTPQEVEREYKLKTWSPFRLKVEYYGTHFYFEMVMGAIIAFNVIIMIVETDLNATCRGEIGSCTPHWVSEANDFLLVIYSLELSLNVFIQRSGFLKVKWNILDCVIVFCGFFEKITDMLVSGGSSNSLLSFVRMLRLARILRIVKILKPIPELYKLVVGFISTIKAIGWGGIMIIVLINIFALISVELITPIRDKDAPTEDWCSTAFSSIILTMMYFFQTLIAGDSWGACVIPWFHANQWHIVFIFVVALFVIQIGFTNLILSVIVDAAAQEREEDQIVKQQLRLEREEEDMRRFLQLMKRIDLDNSGCISLEELMAGYEQDEETQFRLMELGIDQNELRKIFKLLDMEKDDSVLYMEFIDCILKAEKGDGRMDLMMLKLNVERVEHKLDKVMSWCLGNGKLNGGSPVSLQAAGSAGAPPWQNQIVKDASRTAVPTAVQSVQQELQKMNLDLEVRLRELAREAERHMQAISRETDQLSKVLRGETTAEENGTGGTSYVERETSRSAVLAIEDELRNTTIHDWMRGLQASHGHRTHTILHPYESELANFVANVLELRDRYGTDMQLLFDDLNLKDERHKAAFAAVMSDLLSGEVETELPASVGRRIGQDRRKYEF